MQNYSSLIFKYSSTCCLANWRSTTVLSFFSSNSFHYFISQWFRATLNRTQSADTWIFHQSLIPCNFEHCHLHPCNHRSSLRLRRILFFQRFLDFNDFQRDFLEPLSYSTEKRNKKGDLNPFTNLTPLLNSSKPSSYFGAWQRKILWCWSDGNILGFTASQAVPYFT